MKCSTQNCPNEGEVAMFVATNIVCLVCVPAEMREAAGLPEPDPATIEAQVLAFARVQAEEAGPVLASPPSGEGPLYVRRRLVLTEPEQLATVAVPAKAEPLVEGPLAVRKRITLNESQVAAAVAETGPAPSVDLVELELELEVAPSDDLAGMLGEDEAASRRVTATEIDPHDEVGDTEPAPGQTG